MSDTSQTIVAVDCASGHANRVATRAVGPLVDRGIIASEPSDCGLVGVGYAPGARFEEAVDASRLETESTRELVVNGMVVVVGRTVFDTGGNGISVRCEACGGVFEPGRGYDAAAAAWAGGDDGASYACERCGAACPIREWDGEFAWAFGCLGLQFWNWPPLRGVFVDEVAAVLGGRVRVVRARL